MSAAVKIDFPGSSAAAAPHKLPFSPVPNWLMQRTELSQGSKLCYGRLAQYAGKDGQCFPKLETLGKELGVSVNTVLKYLDELKSYNLIQVTRRGLGLSNTYALLEHIWMHQTGIEPGLNPGIEQGLDSGIEQGLDSLPLYEETTIKKLRAGSFYECVCECDADIVSYKDFNKFRRRKNETADDFDSLFESAGEQDKAKFLASIGSNLSLVMQFRKKGFASLAIRMKFIEFMAGKTSADTQKTLPLLPETSAETQQKDTEEEKQSLPLPSPLPEKAHASGPDVKHTQEYKQDVKSSDAGPATVDRINDLCKQISDMNRDGKKRFNPWQFAQGSLNAKCHPGAVEEVLVSVARQWPVISHPWAYANRILGVQSGNYHARDFQRDSGRIKQEFNKYISENPELVPGFSMKGF